MRVCWGVKSRQQSSTKVIPDSFIPKRSNWGWCRFCMCRASWCLLSWTVLLWVEFLVLCSFYCDHSRLEMHKHKMLYNYIYIYICVFQLFSSTFSNQNNLENGSHLFCWCFQLCCIFQVETSSSFQRPPLTSPVRSSWAQHGQNARLDGWHWDGDNRVAWVTHGFLVPRL